MGFNTYRATWDRMDELDVTTSEVAILLTLAYIMNDRTFACHPSQRLIAKKTRLSITTVKSTLRKLKARGLVDWTKHTAAVNRYTLSFLPSARPAANGMQGGHPALSEIDQKVADQLAVEFARLCDSSANFAYNRNTYRKLIRERDLGRCEDLLCALRSEISQDEHLNAENLGAIITNRLKEIPARVINIPDGMAPAMGRKPTRDGTGADRGSRRSPTVR